MEDSVLLEHNEVVVPQVAAVMGVIYLLGKI